jgi:hypothetical protein
MPQIHDTDNYTVPGGIKLFFDDGSGERDLGNMVDVSMGRDSKELEHFTNRSGVRLKDKVIALEESINIDFALDEPVVDNFILFFKGDAAVSQGAGTAAIVDQKVDLLPSFAFTSVGKPGLTAVSARQFLDYVFLWDNSAAAFVDNSVEADTAVGTPFLAIDQAADFLYLGKDTKFHRVVVDVQVAGDYGTPVWTYWNGSTWASISMTGTGDELEVDGTFTFTPPADWATKSVNGKTEYWIRVATDTTVTPAQLNSIGRGALTVSTDYVVDPGTNTAPGRIGAVSGGAIEDSEEIKVSYTYATATAIISNFVQVGSVEGAARLEVHPQSGRGLSFDIEIPKCQLKNNGNLSLNDQEFMKIPLSLSVLSDIENTPSYPYGRILVYDS